MTDFALFHEGVEQGKISRTAVAFYYNKNHRIQVENRRSDYD